MLRDPRPIRIPLPGGVEIALLDWGGDGPLALLHHANGFCSGVWGLVAEGLRTRFRVVALDARGHGDSSVPEDPDAYRWDRFADDLVAVAEHLTGGAVSSRIALGLGHSFGGTTTLAAAARSPSLFERIVLVDPVIPPPGADSSPEGRIHVSRLAADARRRRHVWPSRAAAMESWRNKPFFAAWDPRALDLYVLHGLRDRDDGQVELKCAGWVEAAVFERGHTARPFEQAARVTAPTLALWASGGNFPRTAYEALTARMEDARVEDVECGHLGPMEQPESLTARVLSFVDEGRASRRSLG